ncbi:MAG: biotin transporter BioY [Rhodobacteraceae bacterium]|nr:biotin transporter BioY [Paracoccaceae bacterium]
MTLSQIYSGSDKLLQQAGLVLGGTLLIALAAQVSVPMWPVPITLQTLAILIVGLSFGARLGVATLVAYLTQGAMGLPVFAGGGSALALMGPTAGFLFGFVLMVWIVGQAADRGMTRGIFGAALTCIVASAALYLPGVAWPMAVAGAFGIEGSWVGSTAASIWTYWVSPFLLGDAIKSVLAALIVTGGLSWWNKRKA